MGEGGREEEGGGGREGGGGGREGRKEGRREGRKEGGGREGGEREDCQASHHVPYTLDFSRAYILHATDFMLCTGSYMHSQ